ncbi:hypothetical protein Cgig2_022965 [Carnegiea gigantea]|uniref:AB hydrolase-1 domain-containing protein n=1 Tax=Carnegiea gigantea TaxID=171969 RepID=A0A9Q1KBP5_9CARY|nr:hypothetical protein Cgig2_022965 [Carnegiea gigantea]
MRGVAKENAKYMVIIIRGFCPSKETFIPVSDAIKPPPPKICGTPGGPPVTSPRIKLKDGRHLAYGEAGVSKEEAKYKVVVIHGFNISEDLNLLISQEKIHQQSVHESLRRDLMVGFGKWEFDPLDLSNPFPHNEGSVHLWQGYEHRLVPFEMNQFISEKLPWIKYHEVPDSGHLMFFDQSIFCFVVWLIDTTLGIVEMLIAVFTSVLLAGLIYQLMKPPASKICGSANSPPVTSPRIRLRDGRYLAYKMRGAAKESATYKVIITHGFCASKETFIPVSDDWLQELGICIIIFDRPGYAESDPNPKRSPKNDAFDIQELADQLELGPKVYVIGLSMGAYPVWGCLRYLPHRLAGAALIVPVVNYWWPSLRSDLCTKVYGGLPLLDQWTLRIVHYAPKLAWVLQRWFSFPTVDVILKNNPEAFNKSDMVIIKELSQVPAPDEAMFLICDKILQQGAYESLHRDLVVSFGSWEFDPLDLRNPYPDNSASIHLWIGREDGIVAAEMLRHVAKQQPWIKSHEVPNGGHLFIHDEKLCQIIFRSLLFGENACFE